MNKTIEHRSYGVIVYSDSDSERKFLLVHHTGADHWAFSKGTPEEGEAPLQTAVRELEEETNMTALELIADTTFEEAYTYTTTDGKHIHKTNTFYLGKTDDMSQAKVLLPDEIKEVCWRDYNAALETLTHKEARAVLREVEEFLKE